MGCLPGEDGEECECPRKVLLEALYILEKYNVTMSTGAPSWANEVGSTEKHLIETADVGGLHPFQFKVSVIKKTMRFNYSILESCNHPRVNRGTPLLIRIHPPP